MGTTARADELSIREALEAGMAHHGAGRLAEAEAAYRRALALKPDLAAVLLNLGNLLQAQGRSAEAIACYRRAIASQPDYGVAMNNLGVALESEGRLVEAFAAYRAALSWFDGPEPRANLVRCVAAGVPLPADAAFRELLARALAEAWARPADLARAAITLLRGAGAPRETIDSALHAWPKRPAARELFTPRALDALAHDALLLALLEGAQACEAGFERFLAAARHALTEAAEEADPSPYAQGLPFFCTLARQCFLDDYVLAASAGEAERARRLHARLAAALEAGLEVAPLLVAAVASHFPLGSLARSEALLERAWPEAVRALLVQQVAEPREERELGRRIARLTPIGAGVSSEVRRQYEESPYPRWVRLAPALPRPFAAYLTQLFPHVPLALGPQRPLEILVAGCGTGQESLDIARQFPDCRVLAIDLSLASLAYAARKARELGVANVEHAQADIMELDRIGREFDAISSVGVLHHLAEPVAGWKKLLARLRPGGFMQVGLYSEIAREDIVAARAFIAERGYAADANGIRAAREALFAMPRFAAVTALRDFYGLHECRDLLFHVEEHRFTLPELRAALDSLGVELVGLVVPPAVRRAYAARFPADRAQGDLAAWDAFEREFPATFAGMYLFWVRKPEGC